MKITTEQYAQLIRFLDADMTEAEMDVFEAELRVNNDLRAQLDFEQTVRDSLSLTDAENLKEPIKDQPGERKKSGVLIGIKWWAAAAAIVILGGVFFTLNREKDPLPIAIKPQGTDTLTSDTGVITSPPLVIDNTDKKNDDTVDLSPIYKKYYKKDTIPADPPVFLADALVNYEMGDYTALLQLDTENIPDTRSDDQTALVLGHYYKGLALLQTNKLQAAVEHFSWVLQHSKDNKFLYAKAEWYLLLTHLRSNNNIKAKAVCKNILTTSSPFSADAKKILQTLEP